MLLLPKTDRESAIEIAEKCRTTILELAIPHEASKISSVLTISLGVASITPTAGVDPSTLVTKADRMLYQAKDRGRNRVANESKS